MSNHEKALATYEALRQRKAAKARKKDIDVSVAMSHMIDTCRRASGKKNVRNKATRKEW